MTLRHVIVEGCDGTGKTNLVNYLIEWSNKQHEAKRQPWFIRHSRAATSTGGPVPNLDEWVERDLQEMPTSPPSIYDRHPIISEPIYGPIVRGGLEGKFKSAIWRNVIRGRVAANSLVIWCAPPWDVVEADLRNEEVPQLEGVVEQGKQLYECYRMHREVWPGVNLKYDYRTVPKELVANYINSTFGGLNA